MLAAFLADLAGTVQRGEHHEWVSPLGMRFKLGPVGTVGLILFVLNFVRVVWNPNSTYWYTDAMPNV